MKLNIGSGNVPLPGYVNIDKYYFPGSENKLLDHAEVSRWQGPPGSWGYGDAVNLNFSDDMFDEVIMVHCLEHLSMEEGGQAVKEAVRVTKNFVDIEVPDLTRACELFLRVHVTHTGDNQPWHRIMGLLYGTTGADGEGQFHLCGYSKEYLKMKMEECGLVDVEEIAVGYGHGNASETGHAEPQYDFRLRGYKR